MSNAQRIQSLINNLGPTISLEYRNFVSRNNDISECDHVLIFTAALAATFADLVKSHFREDPHNISSSKDLDDIATAYAKEAIRASTDFTIPEYYKDQTIN